MTSTNDAEGEPVQQQVTDPRPPMPLLHGVRVVDLTQYLTGPTVTRLLAELGADIVKIEQLPHGDPARCQSRLKSDPLPTVES